MSKQVTVSIFFLVCIIATTVHVHARPSLPSMDQPLQANLQIVPPGGEFKALPEAVMEHIEPQELHVAKPCCPQDLCRSQLCPPEFCNC